MSRLGKWLRPVILWDYRRGSWPYDILCALILAFIFLTPREMFRDQPRPPSVQRIQALNDSRGTVVFWVDPAVIDETPEQERQQRLDELLRQRSGKNLRVTDIKPIADAEGTVRAYLVYTQP